MIGKPCPCGSDLRRDPRTVWRSDLFQVAPVWYRPAASLLSAFRNGSALFHHCHIFPGVLFVWYAVKVVFFVLRCFVPCFLWCFTVCSTGSGLPGLLSAVSWVHFLCNLCLLHHNHKKSILHFLCFLHRVPPPPPPPTCTSPVSFASIYAIYATFPALIGKPVAVSGLAGKGGSFATCSRVRGSDRIGTERKQKARVLPFGSALALCIMSERFRRRLGILSGTERQPVRSFLWFAFIAFMLQCVIYTSVYNILLFVLRFFVFCTLSTLPHGARLPGCRFFRRY